MLKSFDEGTTAKTNSSSISLWQKVKGWGESVKDVRSPFSIMIIVGSANTNE